MIPRQVKVELLVALVYLALLVTKDRPGAFRAVAHGFLWYSTRCRELGTWCYVQSIRAESAAKELVAP